MNSTSIRSFSLWQQMLGLIGHRPGSFLLGVLILAATICLPGFHYLLTQQFTNIVGKPSEQQQLVVFVQQTANPKQVDKLRQDIESLREVKRTQFINRQQAAEQMKSITGVATALDYLQANPFLDTIVLHPQQTLNQQQLQDLLQKIAKFAWVEEIYIDTDWSVAISQLILRFQWLFLFMSIVATTVVLVILFNFAFLRVSADEQKNKTKLMLGIYPWTIYFPYVCLGGLMGFLAGILAALVSFGLYRYIFTAIEAVTTIGVLESVEQSSILDVLWIPPLGVLIGLITTAFAVLRCYTKIRYHIV